MNLDVPAWSSTELDVFRIGLGFVVVKSFNAMRVARPAGEPPYPVGIARFVSLRWAASRSVARGMQYGAFLAALCCAAGLLVPFALLYLTLAALIDVT